ncbi:MAG: hypothetical protein UT51_C0013G0002 [Candidatus Nomurabacteria bacterium GW2011_GWC2_39_41]|uniref:Uncharacterized protein n=1 Tax=Candidatus Nomurabacteria bacterium GW2011_GWC2_39_41 TaxID=1618754 RepID=A0A837HQC3_9BACT|nr:MAG: hypothetical protein UT51_C0013G0002 [Candidatus Nomurabacteria bacterium GW2011_GWC2_39_41]
MIKAQIQLLVIVDMKIDYLPRIEDAFVGEPKNPHREEEVQWKRY